MYYLYFNFIITVIIANYYYYCYIHCIIIAYQEAGINYTTIDYFRCYCYCYNANYISYPRLYFHNYYYYDNYHYY